MTHADLVRLAAVFLHRRRCALYVTEPGGHHFGEGEEHPDAVGFRHDGETYVVEAKASRSDFAADRHKVHRKGLGLGHLRYYIVPDELIRADEVPPGWGLLVAKGQRVRVLLEATRRDAHDEGLALRIAIHLGRRACDYQPSNLLAKIEEQRARDREIAAQNRENARRREAQRVEQEAQWQAWLADPANAKQAAAWRASFQTPHSAPPFPES